MAEPFIAEVRAWAPNFAPRAWAFCEGQLLPISQNTALFSLLGTTYGGDGRTTFGLPDCRGRAVIGPGNGPGLSPRPLGQKGGAERVTLTAPTMPSHSHGSAVSNRTARDDDPTGELPASGRGVQQYAPAGGSTTPMDSSTNTGGGQSHENMQPFLAVRWIIALQGVFPSRN
ncbi:Microcystin dependent protein [Euzebya pacifica]|uniref:Microcystin dependent protein n=1 Tax=Euzebya pacifica TaxID=1608957 RepID=A0A346XZ94_9ACTN|nr:tail fiber protein [Euzebya pacifica]AXV07541.1 Microcystin dependent protein [Euzebya pacifica]